MTGVTVDPATATGAVGQTVNLSATVSPINTADQGVLWSSSDTNVATVSGGKVTLKAAGTTTVTATSKADSSKTGSAVITVTEA